jgi:hypothetical protein
MTTITIDGNELAAAAPKVAALYATVLGSARTLGSADVSAEMPDGLAGRVISGISAAAHELDGAVRGLDGMDGELKKRAQLAKIAAAAGMTNFGLGTLGLPASIVSKAAEDTSYRIPKDVAGAAKGLSGFLKAAAVLGAAIDVEKAANNPYIDANRRAADEVSTAAGTGIGVGIGLGAAAAVGGTLPPVGVAIAAGLAFTVLDKKVHITRHIADAVNYGLDHVDDVVVAGEHLAQGAAHTVEHGVGSALHAGEGLVHSIGGLL